MSTPRVGSSSSSSRGSVSRCRAKTTFCWLPPESAPTGAAADAVLIARSAIRRGPRPRSRPRLTTPAGGHAGSAASTMLRPTGCAEDERGAAPVLGDEADAGAQRARGDRAGRTGGRPAGACRCGGRRAGAEQGLQQLGAAGAHEAGQPDDLAGADGQADAGRLAAAGPGDAGPHGQAVDLEQRLARPARPAASLGAGANRRWPGRPTIIAMIRRRSHRARRVDAGRPAPLRSTVARSATCLDLLHPVGDVDDADAAAAQAADGGEQPPTSASASAAVGSSMTSTRASRASALAISTSCCSPTRSEPTGRPRVDVDAEPAEVLARGAGHRPPVERAQPGPGFAAEQEVVGDGQRGHQVEFLVDRRDAGGLGGGRAGEAYRRRRRRRSRPS